MSEKYTTCNSKKTNKLNKLVKTFRGTFRNTTTFGDAYKIPPFYM